MKSLNTTILASGGLIPQPELRAINPGFPAGSEDQKFASLFDAALVRRDTSASATRSPAPPARYVVQPGDNLCQISQKLGINDPMALAQVNNLANPDRLAIGQVLEITSDLMEEPLPPAVTPQVSNANSTGSAVSAPKPLTRQYVVQAGDNLWKISQKLRIADPMTLARVNNLADPDCLAIGQVLEIPADLKTPSLRAAASVRDYAARPTSPPPRPEPAPTGQVVVASWYGGWHHGRLMANGKKFDMFADTVAHKSLPFGTRLRLTNPENGRTMIVTVTDRGPYIRGRNLDVSFGVARKLGIVQIGVARIKMEKV